MNFILSIVSGIISGVISSIIVSYYFMKITDEQRNKENIRNNKNEIISYISLLEFEIRAYLSYYNQEEREQSLKTIKRIVSTHSLFEKEFSSKDLNNEFLRIRNKILIYLVDMNNELLMGDYGEKVEREYFIEKNKKLWDLHLELRRIDIFYK